MIEGDRLGRCVMPISNFFNGKRPNDVISANKAIAYGTAIQAAVLSGDTQDLVLLGVDTHSLGTSKPGR